MSDDLHHANGDQHRPVILHPGPDDDQLAALRSHLGVEVIDTLESFRREAASLQPALTDAEWAETSRWVYYPWRRTVVHLPGPELFRRVRSDRNRNKITTEEQGRLRGLKVAVVGLSVGHAIAHILALESLCGEMRLADFDSIELSNLNRIPATVLDVGVNKAVVAARRIAELDPFLDVRVFTEGLSESNMAEFFDGLDVVVEECDSLDVKVRVRQEARRRGIPVLMETSDRGLFDVERFDQEPDRPLFHGLMGDLDAAALRGLSARDKAPHVMRILEASQLSSRMAASMVEIDRTLSTWPQLGGDVALGAATVAAAVRRLGLGLPLSSGRIRVDLDSVLDGLDAGIGREHVLAPPVADDLTRQVPPAPIDAVVHAIRLAPSGGNSQPWSVTTTPFGVDICLVRERTSAMDVRFRGSYVGIGAATFNARVAAARHHLTAAVQSFPDPDHPDVAVSIALGPGEGETLADLYPAMIERISNRNMGIRTPLTEACTDALRHAAEDEGARLELITDPGRLAELAEVLSRSDRLRYLAPVLHRQMMSEMKWPGRDRLDLGIDVRTLDLDATDLAKLTVASRPEVMRHLADWGGGSALGDNTRDRVNASSALAVITMAADTPADYLRGGAAVQRVWITAEQLDLGVQPVSPVFLYARDDDDMESLIPEFHQEAGRLQEVFTDLADLGPSRAPMLVLRLSHHSGRAMRSERLPLNEILLN